MGAKLASFGGRWLGSLSIWTLTAFAPGSPLIATPHAETLYVRCVLKEAGDSKRTNNWNDDRCWQNGVPYWEEHDVIINDDGVVTSSSGVFAYDIWLDGPTTWGSVGQLIVGNKSTDNSTGSPEQTGSRLHVTGPKTRLQTGPLIIGRDGGSGQVFVQDGATLLTGALYMAGYFDGTRNTGNGIGALEITGAGSTLTTERVLLAPGATYYQDGWGRTNTDWEFGFAPPTILIGAGATLRSWGDFESGKSIVTVDGGTLRVDGSLRQSQAWRADPAPYTAGAYPYTTAITVKNGGTLSANTITTTTLFTVNLDNSTLYLPYNGTALAHTATTIYGDSFSYSGQLTIAVDAPLLDGNPDLVLDLSNGLKAAPGSNVVIKILPFNTWGYGPNQDYVVIRQASATPQYPMAPITVDSGLWFLDGTATTVGTDVIVRFTKNNPDKITDPLAENDRALGHHIGLLPESHPLHAALMATPKSVSLNSVFTGLSGEIHSAATMAVTSSSAGAAGVVQDRVAATFSLLGAASGGSSQVLGYAPGPADNAAITAIEDLVLAGPSVWMQAYGSVSTLTAAGGNGLVNTTTGGMVMGGDIALDAATRAGLAAGYSIAGSGHSNGLSQASIQAIHVLAYGGTQVDDLLLTGGVGLTGSAIQSARRTGLAALPGTLSSAYGALTGHAFVEAAYDFKTGDFTLQPYAGASVLSTYTQAHTETGNAAALSTAESVHSSVFTTLGLRAEQTLVLGNGLEVAASGGIGWQHLFGNPPSRSVQIVDGVSSFSLAGPTVETDHLLLEAGLMVDVDVGTTLALDYDGKLGFTGQQHSAAATLTHHF